MQHFIRFLFIFSLVWLVFSLFGIGQKAPTYTDDIVIFAKDSYSVGAAVDVKILNNTGEAITIPNDCTTTPLITEKYSNGEWSNISTDRVSQKNCSDIVTVEPGEQKMFSYVNESYELFGDHGKYRVGVEYDGKVFSHEFETTNPGFFKNLFLKTVYNPILNLLIWLIQVIPGHSLGLAIIALTLIIKTALLAPNHKALKSQKALQKVQPELQKIKEKYKGDQARIAQETMAVWKKHNVNPTGSCLPILLQFPFLIAIFFVLQKGLTPNNIHLIYDVLKPFDFAIINPVFLSMDLTKFGPWYLALAVGVAQFGQMKLSFAQNTNAPAGGDMMAQQMQMMNKVFTYVLPVMIAFFTLTMPAGVGLYWGISTLYAIGQQQVVNKIMNGNNSTVEEVKKPKKSKKKAVSKKKKSAKADKSPEDDAEDAIIVHKV